MSINLGPCILMSLVIYKIPSIYSEYLVPKSLVEKEKLQTMSMFFCEVGRRLYKNIIMQ